MPRGLYPREGYGTGTSTRFILPPPGFRLFQMEAFPAILGFYLGGIMRIFGMMAAILSVTAAVLQAVVPVTVVAVPEPSFYPELGIVLSGLFLYARSRRK